ncbi:hypothetical protein MPSEU_000989500 [Mayamaea pseudoterrestris]|nr:hypothetical protein MPSEU_000989500 [Mayamaea pseudoterrestris]
MTTMMRQRQPSATTTPEKGSLNSSNNNQHLHIHSSHSQQDETLMQRLLSIDDADAAAGSQETSAMSSSSSNKEPLRHLEIPYLAPTTTTSQLAPKQRTIYSQQQQNDHHVGSSHSSSNNPPLHHLHHHQQHHAHPLPPPNPIKAAPNTSSDLEFFDDLVSEPVLVLGFDISGYSRNLQFVMCASGVFVFSLLYGYLQELISVQLCNRKLGLFLATVQFVGYTVLAYLLRRFVYEKHERKQFAALAEATWLQQQSLQLPHGNSNKSYSNVPPPPPSNSGMSAANTIPVPFILYLGLSLLRALDLGMTNLAMQYLNYPAKTLLKSSRVVFTMLFGVILSKKRYVCKDYLIVSTMVLGLALFLHADANSSAIFAPMGVIMLTVSLICDGAITNVSETIMQRFGVGQDEFIFKMYSIALVAISAAAAIKGDLREGMDWLLQPGTYQELSLPMSERTWTVPAKIGVLILFSSMGFFGSSCSAAITKQFGALTMSITSVTRKATTLFLSFFLFHNVCTLEHLLGVFIFIAALTAKSLRRRNDSKRSRSNGPGQKYKTSRHSSPYVSGNGSMLNMKMFNGSGSGNAETLKELELRESTSHLLRGRSDEGARTNAATAGAASNYHNTSYIV